MTDARWGMEMSHSRRALTYLAITFAASWGVVTAAWLNGARTIGDAPLANQLFSWGPPIAALICAALFHKGERIAVLGLWSRPNRWWLVAFVIPFMILGFSYATGEVFPLVGIGQPSDVQANAAILLDRPVSDLPAGPAGAALIFVVAAAIFSLMFTLTEELGWRGYLYRQWRHLGFWRFSLLQGVIWGVWHWPLVIYFGMVFADDRLSGLAFYPLATMTMAPIATLLRDRGGSIWAPGIWHGTHNTVGIVMFGQLFQKTEPNFATLLVNASLLVFVELFRRRWPSEPVL